MIKDSVSSDPDRLALGGYDAGLLPIRMTLGNIPDQNRNTTCSGLMGDGGD